MAFRTPGCNNQGSEVIINKMGRLIWLEARALLRRPVWVFLAGWAALALTRVPLFDGVEQGFSLAGPELKLKAAPLPTMFSIWGRACFSVGDWGRAILYGVGSLLPSGVVFHILIGLLTVGSFFSEFVHREVLWATPGARGVRLVWVKLLAVSFVAAFAVFLGACGALLRIAASETFVPAGGRLILIYFILSSLQILVWAAISIFLFYLTRSRWGALGLMALAEVGGSLLLGHVPLPPRTFIELAFRSYISDYFINPFAPLGVIPSAFFLKRVIQIGLMLALLGASVWLRGRHPQWKGIRAIAPKVLLVLGVLLMVGGGWATLRGIQNQIAPFALWELWEGREELDRHYIWSKDARALAVLGEYSVFRLPPATPLPSWAEEKVHSRELHRYRAGIITGEYPKGFISSPQDLVLIYPTGRSYPPELEGVVRLFLRVSIRPLMERAKLWQREEPRIIAVWPSDFGIDVHAVPGGLLISFLFSYSPQDPWFWDIAWALTATSGEEDELIRSYLTLFLVAGAGEGELKAALEWLQDEAEGRSLKEREEILERLKRGEVTEAWGPFCRGPDPLCEHAFMKPEAARRILELWAQGEELGHEAFVRTLLEGVK